MVSTCTYELNSVPLDTDNCVVLVGSSLFSAVNTRRTVTQVGGRHGSIDLHAIPVFDEREMTLIVDAFEPKVYEESWRLMRLCANPRLTITRVMDGVRQVTRAELVSLTPDDDTSHPNRLVSFNAVFALPDVFWKSENAVVRMLPLTGGSIFPSTGPAITNGKGWWTRSLGEPDNSPSVLANFVTMPTGVPDNSPSLLYTSIPEGYFGDAPITGMVFRLPPKITSFSATDPISGTGVSWNGTSSEQYTYVDSGSLRVWRSSSESAWESGTNIIGVDYPTAGMLQVFPASDGSYALDMNTVGVEDGNVLARFYQHWW